MSSTAPKISSRCNFTPTKLTIILTDVPVNNLPPSSPVINDHPSPPYKHPNQPLRIHLMHLIKTHLSHLTDSQSLKCVSNFSLPEFPSSVFEGRLIDGDVSVGRQITADPSATKPLPEDDQHHCCDTIAASRADAVTTQYIRFQYSNYGSSALRLCPSSLLRP